MPFSILLVEQKWVISYSLKGMPLIMERLGLSHTRPSYTLANADPEKQRKFRQKYLQRFHFFE
ncbi:MAG: winged helix-turn-helix domain-containing protein [Phocaeicola sp.]|nr:winged helix-turn-helix domain-containing protein [Phocaeicola sp.]